MRLLLSLLTLTVLFLPTNSVGQSEGVLSRLLAPGPLIGGHKDFEGTQCLKCHESGKGIPDSKCLDCHKTIKPFVDEKRGFHGLVNQACIKCHLDHKGRDFDTVKVDEQKFDHGKMTGYQLEGKHADIKCQECHKERRTDKFLRPADIKFVGKTKTCVSCHKKDDVHHYKGEFAKKECNACHTLKSWKEGVKFDHEKDANFKLVGKHSSIKCSDCHMVDKKQKTFQYKWPKLATQKCLTCHEDHHKNKLSPKFRVGNCFECHSQDKWKIENFKHEVTGFKIKFKHAEAQCLDCHKQGKGKVDKLANKNASLKNVIWAGLRTDCLSCHNDFHLFGPIKSHKLGDLNSCSKCHDEEDWKKSRDFEHDHQTRFAVDGAHTELKCESCHLPNQLKIAKEKDPGKKLNLYRAGKWGVYHWDKLDSKTCESCHVSPHVGQFKKEILDKKCTSCHTTEGWQIMQAGKGFDHSKTRFALDGAHSKTRCSECHTIKGKQVYKFNSADQKFCIDCHANIHQRQFSDKISTTNCATCHSTKKFEEHLNFDHSKTRYPLEGSHQKVKCGDCHKPTKEKFSLVPPNINKKDMASGRIAFKSVFQFPKLNETKCLTCHQDQHKGQLGNDCQKCHTVKEWKKTSFEHNTMSRFQLLDKHANVACNKCHTGPKDNVKYKPLGAMCTDCHKDAHKGTFGKQCQECHSFRGWKVTKDFHKNFTLSGIHYSLECAECHREGKKLAGLSQQCISCHAKDDVHSGTQPNCRECHRQHFWEFTAFKHSLTRFALRGAHRVIECFDCHYQSGKSGIYQGLSSSCQSCHSSNFDGATSAAAITGHSGQTNQSDCSACHRNQFTFKGI